MKTRTLLILILLLLCNARLWAAQYINVCNKTTDPSISVALAYHVKDGLVSQGWLKLGKCECNSMQLSSQLLSQNVLIRVETAKGAVISGPNLLCGVHSPASFSNLNTPSNIEACKAGRLADALGFTAISVDLQNPYYNIGNEPVCRGTRID